MPPLTEETNSVEDDDTESDSSLVPEENDKSGHAQNSDVPGGAANDVGTMGPQETDKDMRVDAGLLGAVKDETGINGEEYRKSYCHMSSSTKYNEYTMDHESELGRKVDLSKDRVGELGVSVDDSRKSNDTMVAVKKVNNLNINVKACPVQINGDDFQNTTELRTLAKDHRTEQGNEIFSSTNRETVVTTGLKQNDDEDSEDDLEEFVYTPDPS